MVNLADQVFVRLPLKGVINCRDLGGYPSDKGQATAWKRFLRSSRLNAVTKEDLQFLKDYGVRTVIDLRSPHEIENHATHDAIHEELKVHEVDLIGNSLRASEMSRLEEYTADDLILGRMYISILKSGSELKKVFDIIIESMEEGAILYHCTAGKDRTGIISMLLLGLSGVSRKDILTNYEVSGTNIAEIADTEMSEFKANVLGSDPKNMILAYDYVIDNFGSIESYFKHLGFTDKEIQQLIEQTIV